ncbi:polysaccharide deacetylase [Sorangium cellulosum]|uniref:Polysaccharide deacetylase n=1 Tax=Sorangium cellulosum TaxID=56 RepID=A0A2L0EVU0_SORCE|nr:polysaccharide deacetylase family protein [Sorangium cellulosum]AUX43420.1 polysaccharide deacetylase [Sorangium cellulosum]
MSSIVKWVSDLLSVPWATRPLAPMMRGRSSILVLHRFADPDRGIVGLDPRVLRRALEFLRRERYPVVSLERIFRGLAGEAPPLDRAVAFTLDDGTIDQAEVAAPIFAEFDCPATIFVVTDFLDGKQWCWWHRVEYVFEATRRRELRVALGGELVAYRLDEAARRPRLARDFMERCKRVPEAEKLRAIERLAAAAEVELPARPPARYAPMSWDDVRAWEARGITFGPHTLTHPVLSRTDDAQSEREIAGSWARLSAEARRPVPVFCYPNGHTGRDFGPREAATLRRLRFRGAVTNWPHDWVSAEDFQRSPDAPFAVPRVDFGMDHRGFVGSVSGLWRTKQVIRMQLEMSRPEAARAPRAAPQGAPAAARAEAQQPATDPPAGHQPALQRPAVHPLAAQQPALHPIAGHQPALHRPLPAGDLIGGAPAASGTAP